MVSILFAGLSNITPVVQFKSLFCPNKMPHSAFQVGDIVCAKAQFAGCSYSYRFGKVIKVTPTGRLRVKALQADVIKRERDEAGMGSTTIEIKPSDRELDMVYVGGKGTSFKYRVEVYGNSAPTLYWEHYDPEKTYENFSDNGD